jgi:hypothetical protein
MKRPLLRVAPMITCAASAAVGKWGCCSLTRRPATRGAAGCRADIECEGDRLCVADECPYVEVKRNLTIALE